MNEGYLMKPTVELINSHNIHEVESFLQHHEETSQFLINNLKNYGPKLTEHYNSGNFKVIKKDKDITSVFCLTRRGNLIIQSTLSEPNLVLNECRQESVQLKGFIGEWGAIEPIHRLFKEQNPSYTPSFESREILYCYELSEKDAQLKHHSKVRLLKVSDFSQWLELNSAYMKELSLPEQLSSEQLRSNFESQISEKMIWGLFDHGKLLSKVGLNSKGDKIGQVGGVFTPQQYRKNGFAKAAMLHLLKDCRDLHGHKKSILFTGETDLPAQKLYESLGYNRIGSFALIFGK